MKIQIMVLGLILLLAVSGQSWEKSQFDLDLPPMNPKIKSLNSIGFELKRTVSEATLIQGGYFTLGTNKGLTSGLDDHCYLSFGHPFALTSFPMLSIDGKWGLAESFFDIYAQVPAIRGDSLIVEYHLADSISFKFYLILAGQGQKITAVSKITNLGQDAHQFGLGMVYDAALGKNDDGWAVVNNQPVRQDSVLENQIPGALLLKERIGTSDGLRIRLNWANSTPQKVLIANWREIQEHPEPDFIPGAGQKIYDLALKLFWTEERLAPGASLLKTVEFELQEMELNSDVFMRWDLPNFLSIENGLIFPNDFSTMLEINNLTNSVLSNCEIQIEATEELRFDLNTTRFSFSNLTYIPIQMNAGEIYENKVVEILIQLSQDNQILDRFTKRLLIPATPISDTGLLCQIDSVITDQFPEVSLNFNCEIEANHVKVRHLESRHIFLYENEQRIQEFNLEKDYTGANIIDVVFVIDCSGSMGNDIEAVRQNVGEFCQNLVDNGYDYRLGLVVFSDNVHVLADLTADVEIIKSRLATVNLYGGRENSLGAIFEATKLALRPGSKRTFIWITDEDYPVYPEINLTVQQVVNQLLLLGITIHSISLPDLQTQWCNPLIEPTGGNFYDINGNFRDILLDISNLREVSQYRLTYKSPNPNSPSNLIELKIHYAGLGGSARVEYMPPSAPMAVSEKRLQCYPNPFNPTIQIKLNLSANDHGTVDIFNVLGQRVRSYSLVAGSAPGQIQWNARNIYNQEVAGGTYFIQLNIFSKSGELVQREIQKILYLK